MTETSMDQSNLTTSTLAPDKLCSSSNTSAIIMTCRLGWLHVSQGCSSCWQQLDLYYCVIFLKSLILSKGYSACFRLISDKIMHIKNNIMHTSGSVQLAFNTQMLDSGQLGFSCPVNWKQSGFVGLGLLIRLMIIAQTANPSINP